MSTTCDGCIKLTEIQDTLKRIELSLDAAFPDGVDSHGKYHQSLIDAANAQREFWEDLRRDLKKKGIYAVIVIVIGIIYVRIFGFESFKYLLKVLV